MFICKSQYFVMQNKQKSLSFVHVKYKAFDCGILVCKCLSHNVSCFSHQGLSEQLKGAFQNISAATFLQLMNSDAFCD